MQISEIILPLAEGVNDPNIFKAIFIAGPPGAGKNTVIQKLGLTSVGLKLQDIDHTIAYLNKRNLSIAPDYKRGLAVTLRRQSMFEKSMLGLLINTTGRDYGGIMSLNKQLKEAGYDTFMLFVDADYDVAFHRIQHRPSSATDPKDIGRKVDFDYFEQAFDAAKKNIDFYALMFGNQFALVTNNERLVEDSDDKEEFDATLKLAAKKINRFLQKPLTPRAQAIVSQASSRA